MRVECVLLLQALEMRRVLVPINSLGTWAIVAIAVVSCALSFDINLQPLLAVGSVSGLVIGFAGQEFLLNLFAGISIFVTRPFVVGDRVELRSDKTILDAATVVKIEPLRTVLLTQDSALMLLPNRTIYGMIVINRNIVTHDRITSLVRHLPTRRAVFLF